MHDWLFKWHHLVEKAVPVTNLEEMVKKGSISGLPFYFMLIASSVIATLGLLSNSAAVIIGAMIIAPLMSPIIAIAYWLLTARRNLLLRSILTIFLGSVISIIVAFLITQMIGWKLANSEIVARMSPNLLDLGVAVAAGAAAAFAFTRSGISASLAGIAIAVALMPPLCTVGIALAAGNDVSAEIGSEIDSFNAVGPLLLFITNFMGIVFSAGIVFYWQYFRKKLRPILIIVFTFLGLTVLVFPLGLRMKNLLIHNQIRRSLTVIAIEELPDYSNVRMRSLSVRIHQDVVFVRAEAIAPPGVITEGFIEETRRRLSDLINRPVVFEVAISELTIMRSTGDLQIPEGKEGFP